MTPPDAPSRQGLPIAITMGDPAGIGPEIIAKAWRQAPALLRGCFVAGDVATLRRAGALAAGEGAPAWPVAVLQAPDEALGLPPDCLPVLQVGAPLGDIAWGQISAAAGRAAADAVTWAARAALRGQIAALVTAPLHKEALAAAGCPHPGHTELLQAEAAAHLGQPLERLPVRMMLVNEELRVVLVSIHMALRQAIDTLSTDGVLQTLRIAHQALAESLGHAPRLAVAGLNPHAGEGGLFGREELDIIAPAVAAARAEGIQAQGPFAPDTVFMRARRQAADRPAAFDAVIAMYHDQGLIPVKYLGVEQGVNVTLGLPLVRTSPDHGTAFDIAGQGLADPASLLAALCTASDLAR